MRREIYGVGGYIPGHPSGNKVAVYDDGPSTFTAYDAAGTITQTRPLTGEELLDLNPVNAQIPVLIQQAMVGLQNIIDAPPANVANVAQAQTAIRQLQTAVTLEARVLRRLIRLQLQVFDSAD